MPGEGWILALESATDRGGAALLRGATPVGEVLFGRGMVHGRDIAPAIDSLTRANGIAVRDLSAVAVDVGPGSYTGVRVGLMAAKGLCVALDIPIVGVCSLDAMARQAADALPLCAVLDAKWRQVYAATYDPSGRTSDLWAATPDELRARLPPGITVVGEPLAGFPSRPGVVPTPAVVGALGAERLRDHGPDDRMRLLPLYLRPTEAEIKFGGA